MHGLALVATGGAVCLVPQSATGLTIPGITYRPLQRNPHSDVDLCCIYRADDDSVILKTLLDSMRDAATGIARR